jgi:hypothetical protein
LKKQFKKSGMKKMLPIVRYAVAALLAVSGFVFIYRFIDPTLIEFKQQPLFLHGEFFMKQFLTYPGGPTEYYSLFFTQYFVSKFWGTVILMLSAAMVVYLSNLLLKNQFSKNTAWALSFVPAIVLICLHANYQADLHTDLVLWGSLLSLAILRLTAKTKIYINAPIAAILAMALYFLFGGTALLLFMVLTVIDGIVSKSKSRFVVIAVLFLLMLLLPYYTSITSAYLDYRKAILGILEINDKPIFFLQLSILASVPLFLLLSPVVKMISGKMQKKEKINKALDFSILTLLIIATTLSFIFSFNQQKKDNLLIHFYAKNEKWNEVIKVGEKLPLSDRKVTFQINRALYNLDKLVDRAFMVPQLWGEHGLILTTYYNSEVLMYCSDLFYDMGHIKGALHWAYEAQTKFPYSPEVLKRIATCNLLLGEYATAEKFLTILSQSTIHRKWANGQMKFLNNNQAVLADPNYAQKIRLIPHNDFYSNTQHPQYDLSMLMNEHPDNKMAFEYFMFNALLTHDLSKLATSLKYLNKLGYQRIPVHIEEGLLLFMTLNKDFKIDFGNYSISNESKERFNAYSKILMKYRQNRNEGQAEFKKDFGNTFWYYIQFVSPITTKREFQEK